MTRTASTRITKPESNIEYCKDQKLHRDLTNRIQQQTEQTTEIKPFVIEESLSKNKQYSCKVKKQEVEQQEHRTV
jgi:hypothetical protein